MTIEKDSDMALANPASDRPFSMEREVFLFFGYGAEYSLHDLYAYMQEAGDRCVEIDMLSHPDVVGALRALEGKKLIFITSAHLLYDDWNFFYYKTHRKIVSALHVISTLHPVASVYYPHDLKDPVKEEEISYLPLFDLFLSPLPKLQVLDAYLPVKQVGWIKRRPKVSRVMPEDFNPGGKVFFTGAYQYYLSRGFDVFHEEYAPLFNAGIAVKLPHWHDAEPFEEYLRARGVKVYPNQANSIHVMEENEVIFTQALSSVNTEACGLGKKVCYIRNSVLDYKDPEQEFDDAGHIFFAETPEKAAAIQSAALVPNAPKMDYFNFAEARRAILDAAKAGTELCGSED